MEVFVISLLVVFAVYALINHLLGFVRNKLGIKGKLIWVDEGKKTKPFFNSRYQIFGKCDQLYKTLGGVLAVEYKSRRGKIYLSDIVQSKAAALAARGAGYKVTRVLVKTKNQEQYMKLPSSDDALFQEIAEFFHKAKAAKEGLQVKAFPEKQKCRRCAYFNSCSKSAS